MHSDLDIIIKGKTRRGKIRRKRNSEREEGTERPVDVPMYITTRSISMVCSSEHVGQQCPLRESDRDALHSVHYSVHVFMRPLWRQGYSPSQRCRQHRRVLHRSWLKDAEEHSWKFATRQVASTRATRDSTCASVVKSELKFPRRKFDGNVYMWRIQPRILSNCGDPCSEKILRVICRVWISAWNASLSYLTRY